MVNPVGGSGGSSRDEWCTPDWLVTLIGRVDLDPCSNRRSLIWAATSLSLPDDNGLGDSPGEFWIGGRTHRATDEWVIFVNPPYSRGQVLRWVRHYRHTRYIFLLRWDPSTVWFEELYPTITHVFFPSRRINFAPPPGVTASSNPLPHALYLRHPSRQLLDRLSTAGMIMSPHEGSKSGARDRGNRGGIADAGGAGGGGGAVAPAVPAESGPGGTEGGGIGGGYRGGEGPSATGTEGAVNSR